MLSTDYVPPACIFGCSSDLSPIGTIIKTFVFDTLLATLSHLLSSVTLSPSIFRISHHLYPVTNGMTLIFCQAVESISHRCNSNIITGNLLIYVKEGQEQFGPGNVVRPLEVIATS